MSNDKKEIRDIDYRDLFFKSLKILHENLVDNRISDEVKDELSEKIINLNSK